ncbi:MAG: flagellar export chaperone FlgN [Acidobacteriota bacterium]
MNRQQAMARLIEDLLADVRDYGELRGVLEQQFHAAVRHETVRLEQLAACIVTLVDTLDQRREDRLMLMYALTGEDQPRNLDRILMQLPLAMRSKVEAQWQALESAVRECKALNTRNCELIVEQNALMQRVLHGEEGLYVAN